MRKIIEVPAASHFLVPFYPIQLSIPLHMPIGKSDVGARSVLVSWPGLKFEAEVSGRRREEPEPHVVHKIPLAVPDGNHLRGRHDLGRFARINRAGIDAFKFAETEILAVH